MKATTRREILQRGFKKIKGSNIYINQRGAVYDFNRRRPRESHPRAIKTKYGEIRTEKAVLYAFCGITPRGGQIIHIDGNKRNLTPQNLKYAQQINREVINREKLTAAIRSYINISRRKKPLINNVVTRMYLWNIERKRQFISRNAKEPFINVFADYIYNFLNSEAATARKYGISLNDFRFIIAKYINLLCDEILNENLPLLPFLPTKREKRKQETAFLHANGFKRPRRISLLKQWNITKAELKTKINTQHPPNQAPTTPAERRKNALTRTEKIIKSECENLTPSDRAAAENILILLKKMIDKL